MMKNKKESDYSLWKGEVRNWMRENKEFYIKSTIQEIHSNMENIRKMIDDAIIVIGNPHNLDPDELIDMAINVLDPEF